MLNIKNDWWKTNFNQQFYKIYYCYLKPDYASYVKRIIKFADLKKENPILDLACGNGGYLAAFWKLGFKNLVGLDYNYANLAQKTIKKYNIPIQKSDMRKNFGKNIYDFIILANTSFGYFDEKNNQKILKNCYRSLRPGGKLFIDNLSRKFIEKNFCSKNWIQFKNKVFLLEEREWSPDKKYLFSYWYLLDKGKKYDLKNKLRLYSIYEFKKNFQKAGFKKIIIKNQKAHYWFLAEKD